ncbi:ester cyclase [Sphaerisporangium sp. TRM90804]|uniref:ester cyclase n=1 Tax=Sphaerisporangium sp. TRM90804 TaxID=3031113 RepID=UPI00244C0713|nr:ester cyclase [Sphaerisporangium sp. TRM90804]MDH2429187.1 ester cyclase [Sphaerisporangium sp. TRM90804]
MSTAENKALVRNLIEAWNNGDLGSMIGYWSPDMVHYSRGEVLDAGSVASAMQGVMDAFPDLKMNIEEMIAEDDKVVSMMTLSGTHTGTFLGVPPTGKPVSISLQGMVRIEDGKVVEHWGVADGLALLQQLGFIPEEFLAATA